MSDEATEREELDPESPVEEEAGDASESPLERAERERDEYLANWQRARADYQNLRRRTLDDVQSAVRRERTVIHEDALIVLDYQDKALAAPVEGQEARNLLMGVRLTRDQLWAMLERQGVATIVAEGTFDPTLHQAVATVATEELPPGTIVEVVRRGFSLGEGVLRHAQVKVATAPRGEAETD